MILLILGIVLMVGSFLFALFNMGGLVSKPDGWERGFKKHLACMGGLAIGGVLTFAGIVQLVFSLLNQ
jgi:uncharacterized membrane protein YphA (DoxX/SURF4 family)